MTLYTAKQIAKLVGLQPKHVWNNVRQLGITPQKVHGIQVLDDAQLKTYQERRASGTPWKAPEKARNEKKPKPKVNTSFTQGAAASDSDANRSREKAKAALMVARERRGLRGKWLEDWKTVAPW